MNITCKENLILTGIISLTLLSGLALTLPSAFADTDIVDDVAIEVPAACALTSTLNNNHEKEVNNGVYEPNIGKTTLKVTCNDSGGFSIYAIGFTGDSYTGDDHTKLIGADTGSKISTKVYASSDTTSNWSMKLTPVSGSTISIENSFDNYHVVPDTFTKVATINSGTTPTTGASVETTYSAFMSGTQPADTYTGKVKYTMVHPANEQPLQPQTSQSGKICYYANASSALGTMGCQDVASEVTLLASNFSREGYGFAGWSDAFDYATNTNANFYGPQETITIPDTSIYTGEGKGLSLYAVWVKSQGNLQDADKVASVCSGLTAGATNLSSVSALSDTRDNNTYAIAKLADGKCWMIENLRLESTAEHNTDGTLAQGYGTSTTYGNFGGLASAESTGFTDTYTANSLYYSGTQEGTASINIGTSNYPAYRMPRYNNWNNQSTSANRPQNPTANSDTNSTTIAGMYSYGNYYTWHAAIADLTYNGTNNQSTTNTSLCPTGWRLPQGGDKTRIESNDDNDFWNLTVDGLNGGTNPANYNSSTYPYYTGTPEGTDASNKLRAYPNNFLYSGSFLSSWPNDRGSYGYYWSSTAGSSSGSYCLSLGSPYVYPGTSFSGKDDGFSIRCVSGS